MQAYHKLLDSRKIFLIFFFCILKLGNLHSQIITLPKFNIWYSRGQWNFKVKAVKSKEEFISFIRRNNSYYISEHYIVDKKTRDNEILTSDTLSFQQPANELSCETVSSLFSNLEQEKTNITQENLCLLISPLTRRFILKTARKYNVAWMMNPKYSTKNMRKAIIKNIKSLKMFNEFYPLIIPNYPNAKNDTAWILANQTIGLTITKFTTKDTTQYLGLADGVTMQPFCKLLNSSQKKNLSCIINLEINKFLIEILPEDSWLKKDLLTNIMKHYVRWSFNNNTMWE